MKARGNFMVMATQKKRRKIGIHFGCEPEKDRF
jgi:hypothetical protein